MGCDPYSHYNHTNRFRDALQKARLCGPFHLDLAIHARAPALRAKRTFTLADVFVGREHRMQRPQIRRVRESFEWMRPCGPALVAQVLRKLGDKHPDTRALFPDGPDLNRRLFATIEQVVGHLHRYQVLEPALAEAGRDALQRGARPEDFQAVREEMMDAMAKLAGEDWTSDLDADWRLVIDSVAGAMLAGESDEFGDQRLAA